MRKKTLVLVIALMSVSLLGLIAFQVYWIHHGLRLEAEVFDRNVQDALHQVANKLETQEKIQFLKQEAPQIRKAVLEPTQTEIVQVPKKEKRTNLKNQVPKPVSPTPFSQKMTTYVVTEDYNTSQNLVPFAQAINGSGGTYVTTIDHPLERASGTHGAPKTQSYTHAGDRRRGRNHLILRPSKIDSTHLNFTHIFGNTKADSVIVWKVLGAQALKADSLLAKNHTRSFFKLKTDSVALLRLANDSTIRRRGFDMYRGIPTKDIRAVQVKDKVINIYTDTLRMLPHHTRIALGMPYDSLKKKAYTAKMYESAPPTAAYFKRKNEGLAETKQEQQQLITAQFTQKAKQQAATAKAEKGLEKVMQQMAVEYVRKERPLQERLQQLHLTQLLTSELKARQILTPYHVKLVQSENATTLPGVLATLDRQMANNTKCASSRTTFYPRPAFWLLSSPTERPTYGKVCYYQPPFRCCSLW
jgi:two-component system phosphate regulon sensor histidine kinase PhoR